jgi:hypothetical protein
MPGNVGPPVEAVSRLAARMQSRSVPEVVDVVTVVDAVPGSSAVVLTVQVVTAACASETAKIDARLAWTRTESGLRRTNESSDS